MTVEGADSPGTTPPSLRVTQRSPAEEKIRLFRSLFRVELSKCGIRRLLTVTQWSCVLLLALSTTLPYAQFLPLAWLATALRSLLLVSMLVRIIVLTRSPSAAR